MTDQALASLKLRPSAIELLLLALFKSNCTFTRRLLKSDFSQAPPTSMRAQTRPVFNNRLNCSREVSSLFRLSGRLFHTVGAETRKLLGPKRTVRVREMINSPWSADRSPARAGTEWTGVQMPSKYCPVDLVGCLIASEFASCNKMCSRPLQCRPLVSDNISYKVPYLLMFGK